MTQQLPDDVFETGALQDENATEEETLVRPKQEEDAD